jgi:hypothetical protein
MFEAFDRLMFEAFDRLMFEAFDRLMLEALDRLMFELGRFAVEGRLYEGLGRLIEGLGRLIEGLRLIEGEGRDGIERAPPPTAPRPPRASATCVINVTKQMLNAKLKYRCMIAISLSTYCVGKLCYSVAVEAAAIRLTLTSSILGANSPFTSRPNDCQPNESLSMWRKIFTDEAVLPSDKV